MEGYHVPMKMKRKDFEQVYDHFSDFSISSPPTKIRRLDAELPPISEEEEMEVPIIEHYEAEEDFGGNRGGGIGGGIGGSGRGIVIEELPDEVENQERAIVLFKPLNSPLVASPSNFSVTVSPHLISGLKNQMMCTYQQTNLPRHADSGATEGDENFGTGTGDNRMAVVPWVPSRVASAAGDQLPFQNDVNDMMDAEEMEITTMEVDDSNGGFEPSTVTEPGTALNEGVHQWPQQHCLIPQPPQNMPTPVVFFR